MGFRVHGILGSGFRDSGLGLRVRGFGVSRFGIRGIGGSGFLKFGISVSGFWRFGVSCRVFEVSGPGVTRFRVSGSGFFEVSRFGISRLPVRVFEVRGFGF